jgi:hypothetical protein
MAGDKRKWDNESQIMGTSDNYVTLSGTTESLSSYFDMKTNGYEGAMLFVDINFDATPTDNVTINVYPARSGSIQQDTPIWTKKYLAANGNVKDGIPIDVSLPYGRAGAVQDGSTDSHDVRMYIQQWNRET